MLGARFRHSIDDTPEDIRCGSRDSGVGALEDSGFWLVLNASFCREGSYSVSLLASARLPHGLIRVTSEAGPTRKELVQTSARTHLPFQVLKLGAKFVILWESRHPVLQLVQPVSYTHLRAHETD